MKPFKLLTDLIFPELCLSCNKPLTTGEKIICINCLHHLPYCNYHQIKNNKTENIFYGRARISFASSYLNFSKNGYTQNLIHNLKYNGRQEIGTYLGESYGEQLSKEINFKADFVLGVPLHKDKLKKRGFNQVDTFGFALAKSIDAEYIIDNLVRLSFNKTQTKKGRVDRWDNVKDIFKVSNAELLKNKKVVLVDDVVTTGATLEACIHQLDKIEGIEISVITMAITE